MNRIPSPLNSAFLLSQPFTSDWHEEQKAARAKLNHWLSKGGYDVIRTLGDALLRDSALPNWRDEIHLIIEKADPNELSALLMSNRFKVSENAYLTEAIKIQDATLRKAHLDKHFPGVNRGAASSGICQEEKQMLNTLSGVENTLKHPTPECENKQPGSPRGRH